MDKNNNSDTLVDIINNSNEIIDTILINSSKKELKSKSKHIYKDFKRIVNNISTNNMSLQHGIINETINNISKLTDEYERIKVYQLGLYDLGMSLYNNKFKINNSIFVQNIEQKGGAGSATFTEITQRLTDKLKAMNNLSIKVNTMIDNVMIIIGDATTKNGLANIRIKVEYLIENMKKLYGDTNGSEEMLKILDNIMTDVDNNISKQAENQAKLSNITKDLTNFADGIKDKISSSQISNKIDNVAENANINKDVNQEGGQINNDQIGGSKISEYYDITKIDNWLSFFTNIKQWSIESKIIFCSIRANYHLLVEALLKVMKKCEESIYLKKLYEDFIFSIGSVEFFNKISSNNLSNVLKPMFESYNNLDKSKQLQDERYFPKPIDPNELLLNILTNNYNTMAINSVLEKDSQVLDYAHRNVMEIFYSLDFIEILCKSATYKEKMSEEVNSKLSDHINILSGFLNRNIILKE
jgi:hypothetical protein